MDYPMRSDLKVGSLFPDFELPDQERPPRKLSELATGFPRSCDSRPRLFLPQRPQAIDRLRRRAAARAPRQLLPHDLCFGRRQDEHQRDEGFPRRGLALSHGPGSEAASRVRNGRYHRPGPRGESTSPIPSSSTATGASTRSTTAGGSSVGPRRRISARTSARSCRSAPTGCTAARACMDSHEG